MNPPAEPNPSFKNHGGLRRVLNATRYSWAGLKAVVMFSLLMVVLTWAVVLWP